MSTMRFKIKAKRFFSRAPKHQITDLPPAIKSAFKSTLSSARDSDSQCSGVEMMWQSFKSALHEAGEGLPVMPRRREQDWVMDELRSLSEKKRNVRLRLHSEGNRDDSLKQQYVRLCRLTMTAAEKARNAWWSDRVAEAEKHAWVAEQEGRRGSLIKELRLLKSQFSKPAAATLQGDNGCCLSSVDYKLQRWADHFSRVVNCGTEVSEATIEALPVVEPHPVSGDVRPEDGELCDELSEEEISAAITQLRKGRAPGVDEVSAELLKLGGEESVRWLKAIADCIWREESVPRDWRKQLLIPLHKKGSRSICDNYRGIALLSIPSKVMAKAILNRLKPRVELLLRESQCGFRHGRGCADQLFSLRILMEKAREFHQPLYICFIDLKKAYDSINREALWAVLRRTYNLPTKLLSIIRIMHEDSLAAVRAYGKTSEEFPVSSGVRQGCVLAPTLFNLYFDVAIHMALDDHQLRGRGVRLAYLHGAKLVGSRRKFHLESVISDLEYADDMALVANFWGDLTAMLDSLAVHSKNLGLSISCNKTKLMAVLPSESHPQPEPYSLVSGEPSVEVVSSFQYLGSIVQDDCSSSLEVDSRICKASKAFRSLSRILWYQRKIKTRTKLRVLTSVILPTLLYGLESTVLLQSQIHRLQGFVMRCLRIILGISLRENKRNTTIRKLARQQRLSSVLSQRRLRLLGHLSRMDDNRVPKQLLVCAPIGGSRTAGGQKLRWNDWCYGI